MVVVVVAVVVADVVVADVVVAALVAVVAVAVTAVAAGGQRQSKQQDNDSNHRHHHKLASNQDHQRQPTDSRKLLISAAYMTRYTTMTKAIGHGKIKCNSSHSYSRLVVALRSTNWALLQESFFGSLLLSLK